MSRRLPWVDWCMFRSRTYRKALTSTTTMASGQVTVASNLIVNSREDSLNIISPALTVVPSTITPEVNNELVVSPKLEAKHSRLPTRRKSGRKIHDSNPSNNIREDKATFVLDGIHLTSITQKIHKIISSHVNGGIQTNYLINSKPPETRKDYMVNHDAI